MEILFDKSTLIGDAAEPVHKYWFSSSLFSPVVGKRVLKAMNKRFGKSQEIIKINNNKYLLENGYIMLIQ